MVEDLPFTDVEASPEQPAASRHDVSSDKKQLSASSDIALADPTISAPVAAPIGETGEIVAGPAQPVPNLKSTLAIRMAQGARPPEPSPASAALAVPPDIVTIAVPAVVGTPNLSSEVNGSSENAPKPDANASIAGREIDEVPYEAKVVSKAEHSRSAAALFARLLNALIDSIGQKSKVLSVTPASMLPIPMTVQLMTAFGAVFVVGLLIGFALNAAPKALTSSPVSSNLVWPDLLEPGAVSPRGQGATGITSDQAFKAFASTRLSADDTIGAFPTQPWFVDQGRLPENAEKPRDKEEDAAPVQDADEAGKTEEQKKLDEMAAKLKAEEDQLLAKEADAETKIEELKRLAHETEVRHKQEEQRLLAKIEELKRLADEGEARRKEEEERLLAREAEAQKKAEEAERLAEDAQAKLQADLQKQSAFAKKRRRHVVEPEPESAPPF
jgi:hypothetical protein